MTSWARLKEVLFDGFVRLEAWSVEGFRFDHILVRSTDSVGCILVDPGRRRVLLVRQRRPAMLREDHPEGNVTELVAGRFDVDLGPAALAVKEAEEEAGVHLSESEVTLLNGGQPLALSSGVLTERSYLALAFISPAQVVGEDDEIRGVAEEGEAIQREWVDLDAFVDPDAVHDDVRVWGAACYLRALVAEGKLPSH